jgi:beta-galactosidase
MRGRDFTPIRFEVPEEGVQLDILVENMGRICYGNAMLTDQKGITNYVKLDVIDENGKADPHNFTIKTGWTNYALSLRDLSALQGGEVKEKRPAFYGGTFRAVPGVDTFVNMKGWGKGNVWVNGFNLGRFWKIGPAETLYVPGELLKEENTIQVLDLENAKEDYTVCFEAKASLDALEKTVDIQSETVS